MGKIFELLVDRVATDEELQRLFNKYPDLQRLLGNEYTIRKDKTGSFYVVDGTGEVEIGVGLFMAISQAHGF